MGSPEDEQLYLGEITGDDAVGSYQGESLQERRQLGQIRNEIKLKQRFHISVVANRT